MGYTRGLNVNNNGLVLFIDSRNPKCYVGSGSELKNLKPNKSLKGTLNNSPLYDSNVKFSFDGSDDFLNISKNSELENQNFSVNIWCKILSFSGYGSIFHYGIGADLTKGTFIYNSGSEIRFSINYYGSNYASFSYNNTTDLNMWTFTYDSVSLKIYLNGILVSEQSETSTIDYNGSLGGGVFGLEDGQYIRQGEFSSLMIYNRALNSQEVYNNYIATYNSLDNVLGSTSPGAPSTGGTPPPVDNTPDVITDNIIGWWDSEEWDPVTQDRVPDLAYENGFSTQDHSMALAGGATKVSVDGTTALYVDGVNDTIAVNLYSTLGTSDSFYIPNLKNYTVEVWFRSDGSFTSNGNLWGAAYNLGTRCRFSSSGVLWVYPKTAIYPGFTANTDTWYHLTITMEDNGTSDLLKTYVDGVLINTNTLSYSPSQVGGMFRLGSFTSTSENGRFYYGPIRRYNVPLTDSEVTQNYEAEKTRFGY